MPLVKHLWNYYTNILTIGEKKSHASILRFSFDFESNKTIFDIIKIIKEIKILELEQEKFEELYKDGEIELNEIKHYTDLIAYSKENGKILIPTQEVEEYMNNIDKIIIYVH